MDLNDRYVILAENVGDGKLKIYNIDTLDQIHEINGNSDNRGLGDRNIRI